MEAKLPRVALLIADGPLGKCVANRLAERFPELTVIQEEPERKWNIVRRRARLTGWTAAIGQAAFGLLYKFGERRFQPLRQEILSEAGLVSALRGMWTIVDTFTRFPPTAQPRDRFNERVPERGQGHYRYM